MKTVAKKIAACTSLICVISGFTSCADSASNQTDSTATSTYSAAPAVTLQADNTSETDSSEITDSDSTSADISADEYSPAMWLVTSPDGNTMYMMGSMHALTDDCYPLPDYVNSAYEQADILAVECDISDLTSNFAAALKYTDRIYYSDGTTAADHLADGVWDGISSYLTAHGENPDLYEGYEPWYLSSILENFTIEDAKLDSSLGLDMQLLTSANDDGKEIYEVESAEFQMDMLVGFSEDIYSAVLSGYSEENADLLTEQLLDLYNAWRTGDTDEIEKLNSSDEEELTDEEKAIVEDYNNQMLYERNIGMAETAEQLMADGKNVFYVVGAAHFVGEGGIIDLLEKDGYTAQRVDRN